MTDDDLRYGYAVCRPFEEALPAGLTGVAGGAVEQVRHGDLVAITGAVPGRDFSEAALGARLEDLDWLAGTARAHDAVLAALVRVTSPVPLRLATVFHGAGGVRSMLAARRDDLHRLLARLDGRVEWGVKVYARADEPAAGAPGGARRPGQARATGGRDYLRRRRAEHTGRERAWQRAEEFSGRLQRRLAGHAADVRLHRPQQPRLSGVPGRNVLNAAYLVDRADAGEFAAAVRDARHETPDLRVELTGPWAPYSFAGTARDAGVPATRAGAGPR